MDIRLQIGGHIFKEIISNNIVYNETTMYRIERMKNFIAML